MAVNRVAKKTATHRAKAEVAKHLHMVEIPAAEFLAALEKMVQSRGLGRDSFAAPPEMETAKGCQPTAASMLVGVRELAAKVAGHSEYVGSIVLHGGASPQAGCGATPNQASMGPMKDAIADVQNYLNMIEDNLSAIETYIGS